MAKLRRVCIFCGASNSIPQEHRDAAIRFGQTMVEKGIDLVYGGGDSGIMGTVADAVLQAGGHVTGVFPAELNDLEVEHKGLSKIIKVHSMHERKQRMYDLSDAFITFPGGFGTLDETFEMITWKQIKVHTKPMVIYNQNNYWDPWVKLTENIIGTGYAAEETRTYYSVVTELDQIIPAIETMLANQ